MATAYLNTLARNCLPTQVYNRLPSASFWKKAAKFGKIIPIACIAYNYSTTGQVATLGNLGLLALSALLHRYSKPIPIPILFRKFTKLPNLVASQVLSFLDFRDLCNATSASTGLLALRNRENYLLDREHLARLERAGRVLDRAIYAEWQVERRANVSKEGIRAFLNCYYGENDPFGRPGKVGNYCPPAVVQAEEVRDYDGAYEHFTLNKLGEIVKRSKEHPAKYLNEETPLLQKRGKDPAGRACIVLQMDRVIGRREPRHRRIEALQRLPQGWRNIPNLFSQTLWTFAQYTISGRRFFGNHTGEEGAWTFGDTDAEVQIDGRNYLAYIGGFKKAVGSSPAELLVYSHRNFGSDYDCVRVQRRFY